MVSNNFNFESELRNNFNFIEQTLNYLDFLQLIDNFKKLYEGDILSRAIYRYETVWIPFCLGISYTIGDNSCKIFPPLDVAWVWNCHILSSKYLKDLKTNFGKIIDHKCININEIEQKQLFTKYLWQKFTKLDFEYDTENSIDSKFYQFNSKFAINLYAECSKHKAFFYQVSLPHFKCPKFIQKALERYKKFIFLIKKYPGKKLVPCYAINVIWRTHQLNPRIFYLDMKNIVSSKTKMFCDCFDQLTVDSVTNKLWNQVYREEMIMFGSVYRGLDLAELNFHPNKKDINYYFEKLMNIELEFKISGNMVEIEDYFFEASFLTGLDESVLGHVFPNEKAIFYKKLILNEYEQVSTQIKLTIKTKFKKILSKNWLLKNFELIIPLEMADLPNLKNKTILTPIYLNEEKKIILNLNLNLKTVSYELNLGLKKNSFKYVKYADIFNDYKLIFDLNNSNNQIDRILRANHTITVIQANKDIFQVEVVHVPLKFWSSIRVINENKTVASAHVIDSWQLPRISSVENEDYALDPICEKAILVRDCHGDFAIIKGKWQIIKTDNSQMKKFFVKIIFLRNKFSVTKLEINQDFKSLIIDGKSGTSYGAYLDKGLVWIHSSQNDVEKFDWSVENHLAIVFSMSVLVAFTSSNEKNSLNSNSSEDDETEGSEYSSEDCN